MSKKIKTVLVEYTQPVESVAGRADEDHMKSVVEPGTRRYVDSVSARSLIGKGVAQLVTDPAEGHAG